jgi:hypothetical protein
MQNVPEAVAASPATDQERDVVLAPKFTPAPTPPVAEKPFACPHEGCDKRYIHEYKLNLHLKNAHTANEVEEDYHQGRGAAPQEEDEIEEESDQDTYQEVVPKYHEVPEAVEPTQKGRSGTKASGKGKIRVVSRQPAKPTKRKRANPVPAESNIKPHIKHNSGGRSGITRQELRPEFGDDSEETEDEDRDNTEEEDNVKHMGGHMGQRMGGMMGDDDDEETEDDLE